MNSEQWDDMIALAEQAAAELHNLVTALERLEAQLKQRQGAENESEDQAGEDSGTEAGPEERENP